MPDCIVIGCSSSTKRGRERPNVNFHVFPKTHDKIKIWLQQTNQYTQEQLEFMVQRVFDTNKTVKYRMCSIHFHPDCYYTHGVNKKLKPDAAPTIFPSRITHYSSTSSTSTPAATVSPLSIAVSTASPSTSFMIENRPRMHICHACGQRRNITKADASTNTELIVMKDNSTSFNHYYGTLSSGVQTFDVIKTRSKSTTTRDHFKKYDKYTWTMGDMSTENSIQSSIAFGTGQIMVDIIENPSIENPVSNIKFENQDVQQAISDPVRSIIIGDEEADISFIQHKTEDFEMSDVDEKEVLLKFPSYIQETTEETQDDYSFQEEVTNHDLVFEKKYIVFEKCLDELLKLIPCRFKSNCEAPMMSIQKRLIGTMLIVTGECEDGHNSTLWFSQPTIGRKPVGNILACSSILFTGNQFEKITDFCKYFGISFLSRQTFYKYQKTYLFPTVDKFWKEERSKNIDRFKGRPITVTGDSQCDSPGYSAKYCIYTIMEDKSKKLLDLQIVPVSETTSSVAMEAKGFRRAMNSLINDGLLTLVVATDRHVGIRKIIREEYKNINHQYDIWHYTKSLKKKIHSVSKKNTCAELSKWVPSIANHLWSCSVSCKGNIETMEKMWKSCLYHVLNIHSWTDNGIEKKCQHDQLKSDQERERKWLSKRSEAFQELEKIVCSEQIIKDLHHLNLFCHTGKLEVFHSFVLKYLPKRILFKMDAVEARAKLAALANNMNSHSVQAKVKHPTTSGSYGDLKILTYFPKSKEEWMVRPVYEEMGLSHIHKMNTEVLNLVEGKTTHSWESKKTCFTSKQRLLRDRKNY